MVITDPDFAIGDGEAHYVIDEGFHFTSAFGYAEDVEEEFFEDAEMGRGIESCVEGEYGPRAFEAVSCEVEFFHCVYCFRFPLLTLFLHGIQQTC